MVVYGTRSMFLKKIIPNLFFFYGTRSMFVKKINSAVHMTDLYNLYITLSCSDVNIFSSFRLFLKMSTLNSTFFHVFIVLPFCTIRSLFYCIFSLLGSAIVRLPLLPTSHAPYFRSYASCFTSSSNSSPAE